MRGRPPPPRTQAGIALVLVLWVLALLTVIAGSLVFSSRTELLVAGNVASLAQAEALADAGVHRAIFELARPPTDLARWKGDGTEHAWQHGGGELRVTIRDESAKVDLNAAPPLLLKGLFRTAGLGEIEADALGDAVADWRDPDDLRGANGAERGDYAAAGRNYGPANMPFETTEELRLVLGMSDALYRRLESLVTVHSRLAGINAAVAPREVLLALPGATAAMVDAFIEQRQALLAQGLPAPPFPAAQGLAANATGSTYGIQVRVVLGNNARFSREAVVRMTANVYEPATILAWRAPTGSPGAGPSN